MPASSPFEPVGDFGLEAVALGPAQVHAQQHLRPVLALGAAGAGVDGDDGAAVIVLAREQHGGFEMIHQAAQLFDFAGQLGGDVLAFMAELEQRVDVAEMRRHLLFVRDDGLQALAFLHHLLGRLGVVPEIRRRDLLFDGQELPAFA